MFSGERELSLCQIFCKVWLFYKTHVSDKIDTLIDVFKETDAIMWNVCKGRTIWKWEKGTEWVQSKIFAEHIISELK